MSGRIKILSIALVLTLLLSCATLPPLQEMSNARQTIAAAKEFSADAATDKKILEAERLLERAERRIEVTLYEQARLDALRARNEAIEYLEEAIQRLKNIFSSFQEWTNFINLIPELKGNIIINKSAISSNFVASLELVKNGYIEVKQKETFGNIFFRSK